MKTFSAICAAIVSAVGIAAFAAGGYHLLQKIPVPGDGRWDYCTVDSDGRRLYLSHDPSVDVIDVDSGKPVGQVEKTPGIHGIAVAPELGRGFTSNGGPSTVTIFDLKTLKTLGEVKVTGDNPDAIIYDPASQRVFTFNARSGNATAIDAKEGKVAGTTGLGGKPEFAAADGKGHVFVNLEDKNVVVQIDSKKMTADARWPLGSCDEPGPMSIDQKNGRLFIGCHNKQMAIVDSNNGRMVATVPIGQAPDAVQFDPGTSLAFSSNGDGTVTVIREESPDKFTVAETVKTEPGARTMALDLKTHKIFLPLADRGPAPAPTAENPRPRGAVLPGSFRVLVFGM